MSLLKWKMQTTCQTRGCLKTNGQAYQQYPKLEIKFTDITNAPAAQLTRFLLRKYFNGLSFLNERQIHGADAMVDEQVLVDERA